MVLRELCSHLRTHLECSSAKIKGQLLKLVQHRIIGHPKVFESSLLGKMTRLDNLVKLWEESLLFGSPSLRHGIHQRISLKFLLEWRHVMATPIGVERVWATIFPKELSAPVQVFVEGSWAETSPAMLGDSELAANCFGILVGDIELPWHLSNWAHLFVHNHLNQSVSFLGCDFVVLALHVWKVVKFDVRIRKKCRINNNRAF
jgi:hypothetical protein